MRYLLILPTPVRVVETHPLLKAAQANDLFAKQAQGGLKGFLQSPGGSAAAGGLGLGGLALLLGLLGGSDRPVRGALVPALIGSLLGYGGNHLWQYRRSLADQVPQTFAAGQQPYVMSDEADFVPTWRQMEHAKIQDERQRAIGATHPYSYNRAKAVLTPSRATPEEKELMQRSALDTPIYELPRKWLLSKLKPGGEQLSQQPTRQTTHRSTPPTDSNGVNIFPQARSEATSPTTYTQDDSFLPEK